MPDVFRDARLEMDGWDFQGFVGRIADCQMLLAGFPGFSASSSAGWPAPARSRGPSTVHIAELSLAAAAATQQEWINLTR